MLRLALLPHQHIASTTTGSLSTTSSSSTSATTSMATKGLTAAQFRGCLHVPPGQKEQCACCDGAQSFYGDGQPNGYSHSVCAHGVAAASVCLHDVPLSRCPGEGKLKCGVFCHCTAPKKCGEDQAQAVPTVRELYKSGAKTRALSSAMAATAARASEARRKVEFEFRGGYRAGSLGEAIAPGDLVEGEHGDVLAVKAALAAGGRPNASWVAEKGAAGEWSSEEADRFWGTPLMCAAQQGHLQVMELLVKAGANIKEADRYGWTALTWAVMKGENAAVRFLLQNHADPKKPDIDGNSVAAGVTKAEDGARFPGFAAAYAENDRPPHASGRSIVDMTSR